MPLLLLYTCTHALLCAAWNVRLEPRQHLNDRCRHVAFRFFGGQGWVLGWVSFCCDCPTITRRFVHTYVPFTQRSPVRSSLRECCF